MSFNMLEVLANNKAENSVEEGRKENNLNIKYISVFDLVESKENFYSTDDIEELKHSIELFGIKQNLNVKKIKDNKYKVISGHRRRLATLELVNEGKKEYEFLPCSVETDLEELEEKLLLIMSNSTIREISDYEKMLQAMGIKEIFENFDFKKRKKLKGRTREIIADMLEISTMQLARYESISKNLNPEFKTEFEKENINVSTAFELSKLEGAKQQNLFDEYKEKEELSIKDVKEISKRNDEKKEVEQKQEESKDYKGKEESILIEKQEEGKIFKTVFEIIKDMDVKKLAEYICGRCEVYGAFCGHAIECNEKRGVGKTNICLRWLKTEAQEGNNE